MHKKGILVASFGTTFTESLKKNITAVEEVIQKEYPDFIFKRAFTSEMIIKNLAAKGIYINNVSSALIEMKQEGVEEVYIQPTHIIPGYEYEKLCSDALEFKNHFKILKIGKPLLSSTEDMVNVIKILRSHVPLSDDEALVLMGHGTGHYANTVYAAMDYMAKDMGCENIFVGTVEAYPYLECVSNAVCKGGYKKIILTPLMLVAGEHAVNDMAGEENSWKTHFEEMGIDVKIWLKGLGEYTEIRECYVEHMRKYPVI